MSRGHTIAVSLLLVAALAAAGLFLSGTAGVSSVESTHGLTGDVADDPAAHIGVDTGPADTNGTATRIVVTNNAPGDATITDVVVRDETGATLDAVHDTTVGHQDAVPLESDSVECGDPIYITVEGDSFEVELERTAGCGGP